MFREYAAPRAGGELAQRGEIDGADADADLEGPLALRVARGEGFISTMISRFDPLSAMAETSASPFGS